MTSTSPRGSPLRLVAIIALTAVVAGTGGAYLARRFAGSAAAETAPAAVAEQYLCPMHPSVVQDHPGLCPLCNMKLVKSAAPTPAAAPAVEQYVCPMHPSVVRESPGLCPLCNMRLVKSALPPPAAAPRVAQGPDQYICPMHASVVRDTPGLCPLCNMKLVKRVAQQVPAGQPSRLEGLATITIDPSRQQLIGLRTAMVDRGVVGASLRTIGRVSVDETRVRHFSIKVPGYVEHVYLDFVGKAVKRGQPLFSLYSPEVLAAENELGVALKARGAGEGGQGLVASARRRLELWDVPPEEIARVEREGVASRSVTFVSPIAGVVTKKDLVEGARLEMGAMPYEVVDLATVWVLADIYETELRFVAADLPATLTLNAYPGRSWTGKVLFIDPMLDPKTRTARVRLAFPNPQGELRPELFGEVTIDRPSRTVLRVPTDALVHSGTEQVVFVALGDGRFEPRRVQTGEVGQDYAEVLSGLSEEEGVVTGANFLVDSESRLRASLARMKDPADPVPDAGAPR